MTLMDYCMQYIDEIMDGKRPAPEGITLTETDPVARGMELLQKGGTFPPWPGCAPPRTAPRSPGRYTTALTPARP